MEWVMVILDRAAERDVFVDGRRSGTTNRLLMVSEGRHRFDIGTPADYVPSSRSVLVTDTLPEDPIEIEFS